MIEALLVPTIDIRERIPEDVIRHLANQIAEKFRPRKIILFGSYAYGEPGPESDVDLLVIMETPMREIQQALHIRQYINPLFGLDIIVYIPARVEQRIALGDSFLREIIEKGVILYESPDN